MLTYRVMVKQQQQQHHQLVYIFFGNIFIHNIATIVQKFLFEDSLVYKQFDGVEFEFKINFLIYYNRD